MYRKMWNEEMETIAPDALHAIEQAELIRQLEYVYNKSPFYRRKFQEARLVPDDIRCAEDLVRIPFTTKTELRESQEKEPPFGDF